MAARLLNQHRKQLQPVQRGGSQGVKLPQTKVLRGGSPKHGVKDVQISFKISIQEQYILFETKRKNKSGRSIVK
ncbi:MAG: hypothetical protein EZS28_044857 [Streblomastix strix]|uniref:Uncharacterized protein n=1 Tax=Streblomastix strix TaxID=222440 RepID=A0A5J4TQG8_9EUKA|nr:MAG: hypothetical protein EZS28_044857 [Streblomastix strix]